MPTSEPYPTTITPLSEPLANLANHVRVFLADCTPAQQAYLLARLAARGPGEACRLAGVRYKSVETWRAVIPGYREMEQEIAGLPRDHTLELARYLAQAAAPLVIHRQVEQAAEGHQGLQRDQLQAQQRARDSVLRVAGLAAEGMPPQPTLTVTFRMGRRELEPPIDVTSRPLPTSDDDSRSD